MVEILVPGRYYRSKAVLGRLTAMHLINKPHLTPDGCAILTFDAGDDGKRGHRVGLEVDGKPVELRKVVPSCLVPMAEDRTDPDGKNIPGGDMLGVVVVMKSGKPEAEVGRIEIPPDALPDLELLVEYDHLPTYRKDYNVYPKGHKLA
jgi:hypothetical protein